MKLENAVENVDPAQLQTHLIGLTYQEVLEQRAKTGENRLPSETGMSALAILLN